jgi:hypothetical protein
MIMANLKTVLRKLTELHGKIGGGTPVLQLSAVKHQLQLTPEETRRHILELHKRKLVSFTDNTGLAVQFTKEGLLKR